MIYATDCEVAVYDGPECQVAYLMPDGLIDFAECQTDFETRDKALEWLQESGWILMGLVRYDEYLGRIEE